MVTSLFGTESIKIFFYFYAFFMEKNNKNFLANKNTKLALIITWIIILTTSIAISIIDNENNTIVHVNKFENITKWIQSIIDSLLK